MADPNSLESIVAEGEAPDGRPIVSVLFGMTFSIDAKGKCHARAGFQLQPEYVTVKASVPTRHTKPSMLVRDIDLYAWRNLTDLVIQGVARVEKPAPSFEVALSVTGDIKPIQRTLICTGDRFVDRRGDSLIASSPEPLSELQLGWENAYGGTDEEAEDVLVDKALLDHMTKSLSPEENEELGVFSYPRNPAGKGYLVHEQGAIGTPLPNVEFADDRLAMSELILPQEHWGERPMPASLDWLHPAWFPRCAFFGDFPPTFDDNLPEKERALQMFDADFANKPIIDRPRHGFANGGHPYLSRRRFEGNERIQLGKTSLDGRDFLVDLPRLRPSATLSLLGEGKVKLPAALDLVFLETELEQVTLVWRATHFRSKLHLPVDWAERTDHKIDWG